MKTTVHSTLDAAAFVPPLWRPVADWPEAQRPAGLWPLLVHAGSLTAELKARAGEAFHVQVLKENVIALDAGDAHLLEMQAGSEAWQREVYLCDASGPQVFARTLTPRMADGTHWLDGLGTQPLGERVFAQAGARRSPIEVARLGPAHALYRTAVRQLPASPMEIWARRSLLKVERALLLIYECFLADGIA